MFNPSVKLFVRQIVTACQLSAKHIVCVCVCVIKQTSHQIHLLIRHRPFTQKVRVALLFKLGISIQYCAFACNHLGY